MPKLNTGMESKTAFAKRVGLSKGRISQLIREGLPVHADGSIEIAVALNWLEQNLDPARRHKAKEVSADGTITLAEARRLHLIVQINRAQLALAQERGKLIDAEAAAATVFSRARAERDAHLAWVQRSAPLLAGEVGVDTAQVFAVLDRLMREHLEHLAKTPLESFANAGRN